MSTKKTPGSISFTVPLVPPSVNHYVKHTRSGKHYVTKEAKAFKEAMFYIAGEYRLVAYADGRYFPKVPKEYAVEASLYLAHGQRLDIDNSAKLLLDSLVFAGVIHSDAAVTELTLKKGRDAQNPRTEITVRAI